MSLADTIASTLLNSLGGAPGKSTDNAQSAGFQQLLAIGAEVKNTPSNSEASVSLPRDRFLGSRSNDQQDARDQDAPAAVIDPVVDKPKLVDELSHKDSHRNDSAQAHERPKDVKSASHDDYHRPLAAKDQAKPVSSSQAVTKTDTSVDQNTPEVIRQAVVDRLGNLKDVLGEIARLLAGNHVQSASAQLDASVQSQHPIVALTAANVADSNSTALAGTSVTQDNVTAVTVVSLIKNIQAMIGQLQQALAGTPVNAGENANAMITFGQQDNIDRLITTLSEQVGTLAPMLSGSNGQGVDAGLLSEEQLPAFNAAKDQLKGVISGLRAQFNQILDDNEVVYTRVLSRMQGQANVTPTSDTQITDNRNDISGAVLANAASNKAAETIAQLQPITNTVADKIAINLDGQAAASNQVTFDTKAQTGGNQSFNQQSGGQANQGNASAGLTASSAGQQISSSGDAAFARAMALTEQKPLPQQISMQIKTAIADGSSRIHLKLDPAELGKLDIKLDMKADGKTGIIITAETQNTLNMLQRDAQNLLRALADLGLQTDSGNLEFNLRGEQQQKDGEKTASKYQQAQPEDEDDIAIGTISNNYVINPVDGLDIIT